jgi:acetyl esterase/lipase
MRLEIRPRLTAALVLLLLATGCGSTVRVALKPFYSPADLDPSAAEVRLDVVYRSDADTDPSKHRLDLFLPNGTGWPLLAFVHGGSLENGDTARILGGHDIYRNIGRFYAARGVGVALINYRLQPAVTWRGQVDDVAVATAWLVERVHGFGGDGRVYLSGHSAGSWLAAHVALDDDLRRRHDLERSDIAGVISVSGSGFDLTDEQTWEMFGNEKKWKQRFSDGESDTAWKERASVVPLIDNDDPPFLLIYSRREWPALARQNQLMCAALESANAKCTIEELEGPGHRRMLLAMSHVDRPLTQRVLEELGVERD